MILACNGNRTWALVADLEDLSLAADSYWNGSDESGAFTSGNAFFSNHYDTLYDSWDGFCYSNVTDTLSQGYAAQYNAISGSGQGGSSNYAISFIGWTEIPTITLDTLVTLDGLFVTNNNYAYYSMLNGDAFAKQFGGADGNDKDWFLLTITGKDETGVTTGAIDFYLADFRFDNNQLDYILNTWEYVDLSGLGMVKSLEFNLSSSDVGTWGMNTPAYFALDTIIPEPASVSLMVTVSLLVLKTRRK
ncbi:MAG: DUF4465 domain-containing protein [Sedimentisphaerales bacterium]|nr:DUF4465 domain-containing protein [Sedimentisphaerales bacterium]